MVVAVLFFQRECLGVSLCTGVERGGNFIS